MNCKVVLYALLREKLPPAARGRADLELPEGSTIQDVIAKLDLPVGSVCAVNEQIERDTSRRLQDGDELRFFRASSGG